MPDCLPCPASRDGAPETGPSMALSNRAASDALWLRLTTPGAAVLHDEDAAVAGPPGGRAARPCAPTPAPPGTRRGGCPFEPSLSMCDSKQVAAAAIIAPVTFDSWGTEKDEGIKRFRISFRKSVIGSIIMITMVTCGLMFAQLEKSTEKIKSEAMTSCNVSLDLQRTLVDEYVYEDVAAAAFGELLLSISGAVEEFVRAPAERAVDALLGSMLASHQLNSSWHGKSAGDIEWLAYRSWVELDEQWDASAGHWEAVPVGERDLTTSRRGAVNSLSVILDSGHMAGSLVNPSIVIRCPQAGPTLCGSCLESGEEGECHLLGAFEWVAGGGFNSTHVAVTYKEITVATGTPVEAYLPPQVVNYVEDKSFEVQARHAAANPGRPATRLWSRAEPYLATGMLLISRTAPVAYCGTYSCFEGVVAAEVVVRESSADCEREWGKLQQRLASSDFDFEISSNDSTVFIVQHVADNFPDQQGLLVGAANMRDVDCSSADIPDPSRQTSLCWTSIPAQDVEQAVVRETALATLARFGAWNATELWQETIFNFSRSLAGENVSCSTSEEAMEDDCLQVGTLSIELDEHTRWLVVAALPAKAFNAKSQIVYDSVSAEVVEQQEMTREKLKAVRLLAAVIFTCIAILAVGVGAAVGWLGSRPLQKLADLMQQLGDLHFNTTSTELNEIRSGRRAHIKDISELQNAFYRLLCGVEAFAKFVPETVVNRIVRGDRRATRLHVDKRHVTIMFLKIGDFAAVTSQLDADQLLLVLTRFFTVMTRVAELFEGTVSEILDDGLLVYWNTPDCVVDHASKACKAAMGLAHAADLLNSQLLADVADVADVGTPGAGSRTPEDGAPEEAAESGAPPYRFMGATSGREPPRSLGPSERPEEPGATARRGTLRLAVQIGIHTGTVLSGNIGSDMKMKFGCMGDSVNLASRLQGLCKVYGVSILCSGAVRDISGHAGIVVRKLDRVKVKGRTEPTDLYEVIGREFAPNFALGLPSAEVSGADISEATLERSIADLSARSERSHRSSRSALRMDPSAWWRRGAESEGSVLGLRVPPRMRRLWRPFSADAAGQAPDPRAEVVERHHKISLPAGLPPDEPSWRSQGSDWQDGHVAREGEVTMPTLIGRGDSTKQIEMACSPKPMWSSRHLAGQRDASLQEASFASSRRSARMPTTSAQSASEDVEMVSLEKKEYAALYEESLDFFSKAKFTEAREGFGSCLELRPDDLAAQKLYERTSRFVGPDGADVAVGADWTGVESLHKK